MNGRSSFRLPRFWVSLIHYRPFCSHANLAGMDLASSNLPSGMEDAGMGRIVRFRSPQPLGSLINRVAGQLGGMVRHCGYKSSHDPRLPLERHWTVDSHGVEHHGN